jgi:hypothetical protein
MKSSCTANKNTNVDIKNHTCRELRQLGERGWKQNMDGMKLDINAI